MESSGIRQTRVGLLNGRSPLLRLQSDERLIALMRGGNDAAFELLFDRYRPRLLAFCRHMLGSKEDAEDVLQEVFAASYHAIRADSREINVRPWLYRIARNRCLNHLRRPVSNGRDTMDDQAHSHGISTADLVSRRADFRHLLDDIQKLPETQRTALLLREVDALSYEQIADAMENTVPSVKSLLVRARMSLAEAAEARQLTCSDVRLELAEVAEGLKKSTAPIRRHLRDCDQCANYRAQLRRTSTAMAIALPFGPFLMLKKLFLAKLGAAAAASGSSAAGGAAGTGAAAGGAAGAGAAASGVTAGGVAASGAAAGGIAAGAGTATGTGAIAGLSAVATKAITVTAATALLAGGAVEVHKIAATPRPTGPQPVVRQAPKQPAFQSGGQAATNLPPVAAVEEKLKASDLQQASADKSTTDSTAATDTTATPTDTEPASGPTGLTGPAGAPAPTSAQGTPDAPQSQTGGASLPSTGVSAPSATAGSDGGTATQRSSAQSAP